MVAENFHIWTVLRCGCAADVTRESRRNHVVEQVARLALLAILLENSHIRDVTFVY